MWHWNNKIILTLLPSLILPLLPRYSSHNSSTIIFFMCFARAYYSPSACVHKFSPGAYRAVWSRGIIYSSDSGRERRAGEGRVRKEKRTWLKASKTWNSVRAWPSTSLADGSISFRLKLLDTLYVCICKYMHVNVNKNIHISNIAWTYMYW